MMTNPDLSTLPQRMRYAANVLTEVGGRAGWQPDLINVLGSLADQWEAEDRQATERETLVQELASEIDAANRNTKNRRFGDDARHVRQARVDIARALIESGWHK